MNIFFKGIQLGLAGLLVTPRGFSDRLYKALAIYIASSPRPMHEMIAPNKIDIERAYHSEFQGMTQITVELNDLLETRDQLFTDVIDHFPKSSADFLISLNSCEPNWGLMDIAGVENLPAIKWKLINLMKMDKKKREKQLSSLQTVLRDVI